MHRPDSIPVFEKGQNDNSTLLSFKSLLSELVIWRRIQIFLLKIKLDRICVFRKKSSKSTKIVFRHMLVTSSETKDIFAEFISIEIMPTAEWCSLTWTWWTSIVMECLETLICVQFWSNRSNPVEAVPVWSQSSKPFSSLYLQTCEY